MRRIAKAITDGSKKDAELAGISHLFVGETELFAIDKDSWLKLAEITPSCDYDCLEDIATAMALYCLDCHYEFTYYTNNRRTVNEIAKMFYRQYNYIGR